MWDCYGLWETEKFDRNKCQIFSMSHKIHFTLDFHQKLQIQKYLSEYYKQAFFDTRNSK